ncbi:Proteasome inhibitor PI31 subunit [Apodemus speciosus]|uniref:Proteasome inhibitor PI31 subunit n=1 Tax=Apodemus speciosus TaxID=105296 RepID=A0ABQ0EJ55_APOSI
MSCPQDALVCFLHWEVVTNGYYGLGTGDQPGPNDKKSELLPAGWNSNKELYALRYESKDGARKLLLKAVSVENGMIINVLEHGTQQVADLTLNLDDYIDAEDLSDFHRTYKNSEELRSRIRSGIITPIHEQWEKARSSSPPREFPPATAREVDPLRIPSRHPHTSRQPAWRDPLSPFAVGGEDLDPFGCQRGGMIVDPLRSGFPRALIDPSSGLPNRLPPGAVPPGARFDPFGPIGTSPSGNLILTIFPHRATMTCTCEGLKNVTPQPPFYSPGATITGPISVRVLVGLGQRILPMCLQACWGCIPSPCQSRGA